MVSPALTGFEESAITSDAAYTNPWPIPDLSFVKIAGCAGAVFTGSGSVGTVPFCTKSCWLVLGDIVRHDGVNAPSLTLSSGARRPAMSTEVPPRLAGKGIAAESAASASPVPRIENRLPGAIPDCGLRLAALITPPGVMTGTWMVRSPRSPAWFL
jgi:hypothetical protein